jgi:hypothetical protein
LDTGGKAWHTDVKSTAGDNTSVPKKPRGDIIDLGNGDGLSKCLTSADLPFDWEVFQIEDVCFVPPRPRHLLSTDTLLSHSSLNS